MSTNDKIFELERGFKVFRRRYSDGSFSEKYYIQFFSGSRRKIEAVGTNLVEAKQLLAKRRLEIKENKFFDIRRDKKIRFDDFAIDFINLYSKPEKLSWKSDEYNLKALAPHFNNKYLYEITRQDIDNFKAERIKDVEPATVNRELATIKKMFNFAVEKEVLREDQNSAKKVSMFREPEGRLRYLNKDEIIKLIDNCSGRLKPIVVLAVYGGFRRGEILSLQWSNIDLKNNTITIEGAKAKSKKRRIVNMNEAVKQVLNDLLKKRKSGNGGDFVFINDDGSRIRDIRKSFLQACKLSGILEFHFHDLRHTFASNLVMAGIDIVTVMKLLGHADLRMTIKYSHVSNEHKQHAVDTLYQRVNATPFEKSDTKVIQLPQLQEIEKLALTQVLENTIF